MPLEPGQAATVERVVTRELTADVLGNPGVTLLATPLVLTLPNLAKFLERTIAKGAKARKGQR